MLTERLVKNPGILGTTLAVCAAYMSAAGLLAQVSGQAVGINADKQVAAAESVTQISSPEVCKAQSLADSGKWIEARAVLDDMVRSNRVQELSDDDRAASLTLLRSIDARIRSADPIEVSLQRAEYFLRVSDLRQAERHANAVVARTSAPAAAQTRAKAVLKGILERRTEMAPMIPGMIEQAEADFSAQRYAQAKTAVSAILRSGIELTTEQTSKLESYQIRIIDVENSQSSAFDVAQQGSNLAMLQPGTVRRGDSDGNESAQESEKVALPDNGHSADFKITVTSADDNMGKQDASPAPSTDAAPKANVSEDKGDSQENAIQAAMRAEAMRILAEANEAFKAARYREAAEKYGVCVTSMRQYLSAEDVAKAERGLDEAKARLSTQSSRSVVDVTLETQQIMRDRTNAEFEHAMKQAESDLAAGDVDAANRDIAQADLIAKGGRTHFSEGEYEAFLSRVKEMQAKLSKRAEEIRKREAEMSEQERIEQARKAQMAQATERINKINEKIDRIRALQAERKYEDALKVVDEVLHLDPNNPTALLLRDILNDIVVYSVYNGLQREKSLALVHQSLQAERSTIPPRDIMDFPDNWPEKTLNRGAQSAFVEPAENRKILSQLSTTKMPVDFNGNRFADVIEFVRTVTQVPLDIDWESLSQVGVEQDTPVNLKLSAMPLSTILDRVMNKISQDPFQKAAWAVDQGILTVASDQALRQNRTLVIYNVQDLLFYIPNHPDVPRIDLGSVLSQGGQGGQSPFNDAGGNNNQRPQEPVQTRQERVRQIIDIIQANVDPEGWKDTGGETGALQELNGSLIITNTPKNHREIVGLLSKLREIRNMQINVETKFLLVNQNWFEQIGFDLDIVLNANNNQIRRAKITDPNIQAGDYFDFSGQGASSNRGRRGLQRVSPTRPAVDLNGDGDTTDPGEAAVTGVPLVNPRSWSPVSGQQNSFGLTNSLVTGDFATGILSQAPALGIAGQFLDDIQVDFLIQATQADQRTVNLTAPRLTFTNGQIANIYVVTQQAFVSDLQPVTSDSAVGFDPTVQAISEGVTLLVEGVVTADRRFVMLNVDAGVARIDGFAQQQVTAVAGGQLVNSASTGSFIQLPTVTVTRVRTTVTVPDEGTILLGGQRLITELEVETGVPVLSKIPVLNRFFTNRVESKEEQTLLVLLKPTILIQGEQEEKAFPGLSDAIRSGLNFTR